MLFSCYRFLHFTFSTEGIVGLNTENVTVTEGTDDFAVVRVSFLSPAVISDATFTELRIFTIDGSAMGTVVIVQIDSSILV